MKNNKTAAERLKSFPEYPYAELARMKKRVEEIDTCSVLDLSIGSPTFPPLKEYMDKLGEFITHDKSHLYPATGAIPELKGAIKRWYVRRFGVHLADDELYPLIGAKDGVSHIPLALLNEGDEILIPNPGYPGFVGPATMIGAVPVSYNLPEEGSTLLEEIKKMYTPRTKAIWINCPGNPTGYQCSIDELKVVVRFAKKHKICILFDNAYSEITYDNRTAPSILEIPGASDIAIEIGSFSKTFSFAGFRMAWIVGNKDIIASVAKVKSQMDSGLMHPFQLLGAYTLDSFNEKWYESMIAYYKNNRDKLCQSFAQEGFDIHTPSGALYLWIPVPSTFKNGFELTQHLLIKRHILVTPGSIFGSQGENFVRACFSSDLSRISDYFPFNRT